MSAGATTSTFEELDTYYAKYRTPLRRTFRIVFDEVSRLGTNPMQHPLIAHQITLASEHLYLPARILPIASARGELESFAALLYPLSRIRTFFARLFIDAYPSARFRLERSGPMLVRHAGDSFLRLKKPDDVIAFCLRSASTEQFMVFVGLFGAMASHAPKSVPAFFDLFERVLKSSSWTTIRDWIARGVDLISSGRNDDGISFLLGLSRESRALLGMRFAVLEDRRNVLHIYCASFGGRVYGIHDFGVSIFGVSRPYTDGASIFLPETVDFFRSIEANESAYTVLATLQACFVHYGSFEFDEAKIVFAEELQSRYGTTLPAIMEDIEKHYGRTARTVRERATGDVEAVFGNDRVLSLLETPHEEHFLRYPTPDLWRELFYVVERLRIEAIVARRYPGFSDDIARVNRAILNSIEGPGSDPATMPEELTFVLRWVLRLSLGDTTPRSEDNLRLNRIFGEIDRLIPHVRWSRNDVHDSARICFELYNLLFDTYAVVPWCAENDPREIFDHRCLAVLEPAIVADVTPDLITGRRKEKEFVSEADPDETEIDLTSLSRTERKAHDLRQAILSGNVQIFSYPEYDIERGAYVQRHCTVYESSLEPGDPKIYDQAIENNEQIFKKLKKRFQTMQPDALSIERRWLVGEEIHIGDATDYVTDLMRGESPDEKIYIRRNRNDRSIAVAVLVDASSSTDEEVNGVRIIETERTAVSLLASALSLVGDSFALYTFFSMGRRNVFVSAIKRFDEPWNELSMSRIGSLSANASNRDGCALRHVPSRLLEREERTKLLILLSDGIPADSGYGSRASVDTNSYAIEDTRRAIIEARTRGVVPYCITIDHQAREYTERLYGEYHYTILSDIGRLPEKLSSLYLKLTR